ncbi:sushi, nidogen and EGF-like domain-containing protein 1 [Mytilus edulis]|uniref:sushi, nidogen and EGF-like domain-containing protein 1 n=1 Tax=Mytilus edulis TaxID=6550 RepID=UPI0039EDF295
MDISMISIAFLISLFFGQGVPLPTLCVDDKVDGNCDFMKCVHGMYIKMPGCPVGQRHQKYPDYACVLIEDPDACLPDGSPIPITQPQCTEDKVNETSCTFMKCVHKKFIAMPGCPSTLRHRKDGDFACVPLDHPDVCVPSLTTDKIITDPDPCKPSPCLNGGHCIGSSPPQQTYMCVCNSAYSGQNCQIGNACVNKPCLNGGSCTGTIDGVICICLQNVDGFSYHGPNCELKSQSLSKVCADLPCRNGGTCHASTTGFSCTCYSAFTGQFCELAFENLLTGCDVKPCLNGGTCFATPTGHQCVCTVSQDGKIQYTGTHCETAATIDTDHCSSSPCLHGGTCFNMGNSPGYVCQCVTIPTGKTYGGLRCEEELTSSAITDQCQTSSSAKFADSEECQRFYDCSIVYANVPLHFKQHLDECIYPQMFNDITNQCDNFTNVNCGSRKVLVDGCDYSRNKPLPGHSEPCTIAYPSCRNKDDGLYEHPDKQMTPHYIKCFVERMMGTFQCEEDQYGVEKYFYKGTCTSQYQIPKAEGGKLIDCVSLGDGYYPDEDIKSRYITCINNVATVHDCNYPLQFSPLYKACMFL